jgi:hypothetical protein
VAEAQPLPLPLDADTSPAPPVEGRRRRNEGIRTAALNTWEPWRHSAEAAIVKLADAGAPFTSDDLVDAVGLPALSSTNALGALFAGAARRGLIVRVGYTPSRRASRHNSVVAVWQGTGSEDG